MASARQVLIVDNSEFFANMVADKLMTYHEMNTTTAMDTEQGLTVLNDQDVACVISNYEMPEMTGLEFLDYVHDIEPGLPFIFLTGNDDDSVKKEALAAGADAFLNKQDSTDTLDNLAEQVKIAVK